MNRTAIAAALVCLLAACGGGGGGGSSTDTSSSSGGTASSSSGGTASSSSGGTASSSSGGTASSSSGGTSVPDPVLVSLTEANYVSAAQQAVSMSAFFDATGSMAVGAQAAPRTGPLWLANRSLRWARDAISRTASSTRLAVGAVTTESVDCAGGGSLSISVNDANGNGVSDTGDSVVIVASSCVEDSITTNGKTTVSITKFEENLIGLPGLVKLEGSIALEDFSAAGAAGSVTASGSLTFTDASYADNNYTSTVTASSLTTTATFGTATVQQSLTDFKITESVVPVGETDYTRTAQFSGTLTSSLLDAKSVEVSTTTAFGQSSTDPYPTSGVMLITGEIGAVTPDNQFPGATRVQLTANPDGQTVFIEVDTNGDGGFGISSTKRWDELI
jgi:hypothetical protein